MGKELDQSAGFQVGLDEQCARQGDTEARNGRREQHVLLAVPRSLTGVAVVQFDPLEPEGRGDPFPARGTHMPNSER